MVSAPNQDWFKLSLETSKTMTWNNSGAQANKWSFGPLSTSKATSLRHSIAPEKPLN
jgi:hypothetical protein